MRDSEGIMAEIHADERATAFQGYTGWSENFQNAIGSMVDEDLSISSRLDPRRDIHNPFTSPIKFAQALVENHRTRKIAQMQKLIESGKIRQEDKDAHTERKGFGGQHTNWESLAVTANEYLDANDKIETQAEFEIIRKEELAQRRAIVNDARGRSTNIGAAGSFAGSMVAGSALEPIAVLAAPFALPITGARELSKVMYAVHVGRNAALLNVGIQIPVETFVIDWKEEIGAEYTFQDAMINLSAAGAFGGGVGFSGTIAGSLFGHKTSSGFEAPFLSKDRSVVQKAFEDEGFEGHELDVLTEAQTEMNNRPAGADQEEFATELEVRQEEMNKDDLPADPEPDEIFDATQATPIKDEVKLTDDGEVVPIRGKVITKEDRMKALEAEEVDPLDAMLDELPDDLMFRIDGKSVKAKNLHKPIDKDLREVKRIQECLLGG